MVSQIPSGSQVTLRNTAISASRALYRGTYTFFSRTPLQFFLTFLNTLQLQPLPSPCFWLLNTLLILTFSFFLINCQSLAISHHSCVAPSVPCSTLSRVRQAKGKKKKETTRGWVSRQKFMLSPVSVSSITVGTGSENNCRETLWVLERDTLCVSAGQQPLLTCLGTCDQRALYRGSENLGDRQMKVFQPMCQLHCAQHLSFTLKVKGTFLLQRPKCQTPATKCEGSRVYR